MTLQKHSLDAEQIFTIPAYLSTDECDRLIAQSEGLGYGDAPITTFTGFAIRKDVRDNLRVMNDDADLAAHWFVLLKPFMPEQRPSWNACGMNERFRFYRYDVGQKFAPHFDACFRRSEMEESFYTFMIYLNDDFEGGETNFYLRDGRLRLSVKPEKGMALIFWHDQMHEGAPVRQGRKYVVRSDVMYRRAPAGR